MTFLKLDNISTKFLSVQLYEKHPRVAPHDALSSARLVTGLMDAAESGCMASSTHGGLLESSLA